MLTPAQLHDLKASNDIYLVNVHVPYEGEIPGTDAFIPYTEISGRLDELPTAGIGAERRTRQRSEQRGEHRSGLQWRSRSVHPGAAAGSGLHPAYVAGRVARRPPLSLAA